MPDAWPYTKPEVTELIVKMLTGYERAASGGPYVNGWMTVGDICAEMLERHDVRLERCYLEEILLWLQTVGCVECLVVDHGFGRLPRWRIRPGVNPGGAMDHAGGPLGG